MHLPNNLWKSPVIQERLMVEAAFEGDRGAPETPLFWVVVPQADTKDDQLVFSNFEPTLQRPLPHELQIDFAKGLQKDLQKEAGFDGLWVVGWTHPPSVMGVLKDMDNCWNRLIFIWLDKDGDPQFTLESELAFVQIVQHGIEYYIGLAHDAHKQWKDLYSDKALKADMDLTEDQQRRAALEALN